MGRKPTEFPEGISVHGNRIIVRFMWNGERVREPLPYPVTQQNIARASRLRGEITSRVQFNNFTEADYRQYFPDSKRIAPLMEDDSFGVLAQQWLDSVEVSANTRNEYRKILNKYWMPRFAPRPIKSIIYRELRVTISQIPWTSIKTRNNALVPLRGVFDMAAEDEIIDRDSTAKLKNLKHQKSPPDPFTRDEGELIIKTLYARYTGPEVIHAAYFEFAFFTGMRPSEILALRWDDIDFRSGYARVSKAQSKGRLNDRTKVAEVRDVLLNERALHALQRVNLSLNIQDREYVTNISKAKALDRDRLSKIKDPHIAMSLELQAAFGLRREEAMKLQPAYADREDTLVLKPSWTKGGRPRKIPILNTQQREVLDRAHQLAGKSSMIPPSRSYKTQQEIYERECRRAGLHQVHGLRHAYAQTRYRDLTGRDCPALGGKTSRQLTREERTMDRAARLQISAEMGHGREQVTAIYIGR